MIASIRYTAAAPSTAVLITMEGGEEWHTDAALPPDTHLRAMMHEWLAENAPAAFVPPALTVADYARSVDEHVEIIATLRGYKSGAQLCTYLGSGVPLWAADAAAYIAWRDAVWMSVYATQASNKAPSLADLIAGLPGIEWAA